MASLEAMTVPTTERSSASPFLSVVIPAFDEEGRIGASLDSVRKHTRNVPVIDLIVERKRSGGRSEEAARRQ